MIAEMITEIIGAAVIAAGVCILMLWAGLMGVALWQIYSRD